MNRKPQVTAAKIRGARWLAAALLALLGACAGDVSLDGSPDRVWPSSRSLDNASSCIIRALDERGSGMSPPVTHERRVVTQGKVYEVRPKRDLAVTSETYFVRLEKIDDRITRVSLFVESPWKGEVTRAVASCAKN